VGAENENFIEYVSKSAAGVNVENKIRRDGNNYNK
jgi:hypothetical protein